MICLATKYQKFDNDHVVVSEFLESIDDFKRFRMVNEEFFESSQVYQIEGIPNRYYNLGDFTTMMTKTPPEFIVETVDLQVFDSMVRACLQKGLNYIRDNVMDYYVAGDAVMRTGAVA